MFTGIVQGMATVAEVDAKENFRSFRIALPEGKAAGAQIGASVAINGTCLTVTAIDGDVLSFDVMAETLRSTSLGGLEVRAGLWAAAAASVEAVAAAAAAAAHWQAAALLRPQLPQGAHIPSVHTIDAAARLLTLSRRRHACCLQRAQPGSRVNFERSARVGDEIGGHNVSGHVHCTARIAAVEDTENNRRAWRRRPGGGAAGLWRVALTRAGWQHPVSSSAGWQHPVSRSSSGQAAAARHAAHALAASLRAHAAAGTRAPRRAPATSRPCHAGAWCSGCPTPPGSSTCCPRASSPSTAAA